MEPCGLSKIVIASCHESDPVLLLFREASAWGRVSILPSIGHISTGSPPTLLSVFEKPILIFLNFSNGHGRFARITEGVGSSRGSQVMAVENAVIPFPVMEREGLDDVSA